MVRSVILYHRSRVNGDRLDLPRLVGGQSFNWETCLRQITLGFLREADTAAIAGWERLEGEEAYRFLLFI